MKRIIEDQLLGWMRDKNRKPLMLRGARQVGKTWSVIDFGKTHFKGSIHHVDLEQHPNWHNVFDGDLVVQRILSELEILLDNRIVPEQDLLFFDEIQTCPRAIMALRYFYEEAPELHIIAAGSLIEFAIGDIPVPVGRVRFVNLRPMNFIEYLWAIGRNRAAEVIMSPPRRQPDTVHDMLIDELRRYLFIGGMPECVKRYRESGSMREAIQVQHDLITAFRQDFSKYAPYSNMRCLDAVLSSVAANIGNQIKYTHLTRDFSIPTIKKALDLLSLSLVIKKIPASSPSGLPLGASASEKRFKALMLDVGLMQKLSGMPVDVELQKKDLLAIYRGAMAEQFVGQEFLAAGHDELYYWSREAKSSTAEVDYLLVKNGVIHPVEVKSGASGRLKSMHMLLNAYPNSGPGYVFSAAPYSELPEQRLVFLPIYYAYQLGLPDLFM